MLRDIISYSKSAVRNLPVVKPYLKARSRREHFRVERELIQGTHRNTNPQPSIIHFSLNKAATQYTKKLLRRCVAEAGMVSVGLHDYAFHTDFPYLDQLSAEQMEKYQHVFKPRGYLYSVFGGMIEGIPEVEKFKILLMVRDPRDVLVSEYYSIAYSHPVPDERGSKYDHFMNRRKTAQGMSIDDFVVADCGRIYDILARYKALLVDRVAGTYVTSYEEMIADFPVWLDGLLKHLCLEISEELRQSLIVAADRSRPKEENIHKHVRKGRAGDYREKLKAETVEQLNAKFRPLLATFGYSIQQA